MWIDAICINQSNVAERELQVGLMRDIYQQADGVVIWLGLRKPKTELAFEFLRSWAPSAIGTRFRNTAHDQQRTPATERSHRKDSTLSHFPPRKDGVCTNLLLRCAYPRLVAQSVDPPRSCFGTKPCGEVWRPGVGLGSLLECGL